MQTIILPSLFCPFPSSINQHAEVVHQKTVDWATSLHLLTSEAALKHLYGSKIGWLVARAHPTASLEELQIASDWTTLFCLLDDLAEDMIYQTEQLAAIYSRVLEVLRGASLSNQDGPVSHGLYNLRQRMLQKASPAWMERFVRRVKDWLETLLWEAINRAKKIMPNVAGYTQMRQFSVGLYIKCELSEITDKIQLPAEVREHATVQQLMRLASHIIAWSNDILSLPKELEQGEIHNIVLTMQHEHSLTIQEAIARAAQLHDTEVQTFIDLEQTLPSFGAADPDLKRYIAMLKFWVKGNLDWSYESKRYQPADYQPAAMIAV